MKWDINQILTNCYISKSVSYVYNDKSLTDESLILETGTKVLVLNNIKLKPAGKREIIMTKSKENNSVVKYLVEDGKIISFEVVGAGSKKGFFINWIKIDGIAEHTKGKEFEKMEERINDQILEVGVDSFTDDAMAFNFKVNIPDETEEQGWLIKRITSDGSEIIKVEFHAEKMSYSEDLVFEVQEYLLAMGYNYPKLESVESGAQGWHRGEYNLAKFGW